MQTATLSTTNTRARLHNAISDVFHQIIKECKPDQLLSEIASPELYTIDHYPQRKEANTDDVENAGKGQIIGFDRGARDRIVRSIGNILVHQPTLVSIATDNLVQLVAMFNRLIALQTTTDEQQIDSVLTEAKKLVVSTAYSRVPPGVILVNVINF